MDYNDVKNQENIDYINEIHDGILNDIAELSNIQQSRSQSRESKQDLRSIERSFIPFRTHSEVSRNEKSMSGRGMGSVPSQPASRSNSRNSASLTSSANSSNQEGKTEQELINELQGLDLFNLVSGIQNDLRQYPDLSDYIKETYLLRKNRINVRTKRETLVQIRATCDTYIADHQTQGIVPLVYTGALELIKRMFSSFGMRMDEYIDALSNDIYVKAMIVQIVSKMPFFSRWSILKGGKPPSDWISLAIIVTIPLLTTFLKNYNAQLFSDTLMPLIENYRISLIDTKFLKRENILPPNDSTYHPENHDNDDETPIRINIDDDDRY